MTQIVLSNSLQSYLIQINRFPLLSKEEEFDLAVTYRRRNDLDAAHKLITSNLRFVVKIAMEYRNYGLRLTDLVQEGNIGLMKAVKKFDPFKGYRLITYAVWWIRSHIQAFILKNWSLVNKGVAALKKKLFYQLEKTNSEIRELEKGNPLPEKTGGKTYNPSPIAYDLSLDVSLDNRINEEEDASYLDMLPDPAHNPEETACITEEHSIATAFVANALAALTEKQRFVIENRFMKEEPSTLQEIGDMLKISRERVRQIEKEAVTKLRQIKRLKALA